jgi:eukaryotic-like serine/threonine-protein kinase
MAENQPFDSPSFRTQNFTKTTEVSRPPAQIRCPVCGLAVASDTRFCPNDATPLQGSVGAKTITNYQFIRLIGEGGMANVYEAEHVVLKKRVAIKVLKAHLSETTAPIRFQQEAQTASRLRHPNIVGVYDCGISELGEPYMVMDLVAGETLDKRLKQGPLSVNESLEIIKQVCAGVACAHENGVLHRDLKPSNIILEEQGSEKSARVLDFGIAKIVQETDAAVKTRTGELFGTPTYMSPEQISGETLDQRSDVFAIGCILYELLTGQPPVVGNTIIEIMFKQVNETPCSLSEASLGRKFPRQLENLVFRAIAKESSSRFATAKRMLVAIENLQSGISDEADPPTKPDSRNSSKFPQITKKVNQPQKQQGNRRFIPLLAIGVGIAGMIALCAFTINGVMKTDTPVKTPEVNEHIDLNPVPDTPGPENEALEEDSQFLHQFNSLRGQRATDIVLPIGCSDKSLKLIGEYKAVTKLTLNDCSRITVDGFKYIYSLPELQILKLGGTKINTIEAMHLLSEMPRLTQLDLSDVLSEDLVSSKTNGSVTAERKNGNLEEEKGERTELGKEKLEAASVQKWDKVLQALTGPRHLTSLSLKDSAVDKEGLTNLPKLRKLTKLILDRSPWIDDDAVAKLGQMDSLTQIMLNKCHRVSPQIGKKLSKFKNLEWIELSDTGVNDQTLKDMSNMHLKRLDVRKCVLVTKEAAAKFHNEHPDCKFDYSKNIGISDVY